MIIKALKEINSHHPENAIEPLLEALEAQESARLEPMLNMEQVLKIIPVTKLTIREAVKAGVFPKPVRITKRLLYWKASDIRAICNGNYNE